MFATRLDGKALAEVQAEARTACEALTSLRDATDALAAVVPLKPASEPEAAPTVSSNTSNFAIIVGNRIMYRGRAVKLRGVNFSNISGWKVQKPAVWGMGLLSDVNQDERDYARVKSMGANHIRFGLAIHWWIENKTAFWAFMDQHVAWARKYNLWLIPELHVVPGYCIENYSNTCSFWTAATEQTQIEQFWIDFAGRYNDNPVMFAFDLLNEPTPPGPGWQSRWWEFASRLANAIAKVNQTAKIVVETNPSARIWEPIANAPADRIIYSCHWYKPMALTHGPDTDAGGTWPGSYANWYGRVSYWDKAALLGRGDKDANISAVTPVNWAEGASFPLYIGEWGCNLATPPTVAYTKDMADIFVNHLPYVGHAFYSWRGNKHQFGLYPPQLGNFMPWMQEMEEAVKLSFGGATDPAFAVP